LPIAAVFIGRLTVAETEHPFSQQLAPNEFYLNILVNKT